MSKSAQPTPLAALLAAATKRDRARPVPTDSGEATARRRQRVLKEAREALAKGDDAAADRALQAYLQAGDGAAE